jgi:D-alanyl-D-alanine carboxypeptidase/D-alanyl-D-alanine-endopeptidase (penicillin-binding protein 4)
MHTTLSTRFVSITLMTLLAALSPPLATAAPPAGFTATALPPAVERALQAAKLPRESLGVMVQEVSSSAPRLVWRGAQPMNPASLTKLLTTYAALDLLGPGFAWVTPVWLQGTVSDGVLEGNLVIKGTGDPKLVMERLWLMLRRVQQMGVHTIHGDIVLDRSAFSIPEQSPGSFDGEPLRPYNVQPDALLLNHKAILLTFAPAPDRKVATISADPPLADTEIPAEVPLSTGPCDDYRSTLQADYSDPGHIKFSGTYPVVCGERLWPIADPTPATFNARLLEGMWHDMGGKLSGSVRDGVAPQGLAPSFQLTSPSLPELIRDINKFSNNVMAQQVFYTLGYTLRGVGTPEASRDVLRQWAGEHLGDAARGLIIDNGSGLSRETRMSPQFLGRLLLDAWASPLMPELMSSLPLSGVDGTMRRSQTTLGRSHLKTGSLRDVSGVAGYVLGLSGRRYVVVAIVNNPNVAGARPVLDAVVQWALNDGAGD